MAVIDFVSGHSLPLFSQAVHPGWAAMASLAHHSARDFVQVPLEEGCNSHKKHPSVVCQHIRAEAIESPPNSILELAFA